LGWVGHASRCYQELTGQQNVELAARIYGIDPVLAWARAEERLGIGSFAKRAVSTMSRGQQQRIALGRALVHDPSVLLMDEPWSGLDSKGCEHLDDVLRQERERGTLVIVVTHTPDAAERLGGARVRLERGRVVDNELGWC
jgi:heme exporter protein A